MNALTASGRHEIEGRLSDIGKQADDDVDLAEAALLLAALDRPRVPLERYRDHIAMLQLDTAREGTKLDAERSLRSRLEALRTVIVEQYGYRGDRLTYDDLQNANLIRVIDRRKGLPVALGILFIAAARHQGWSISGLNFPGHFLLSLELGGARVIVDPFDGAKALNTSALRKMLKAFLGPDAELRPPHYAAASSRAILLRLQDNIKLRLLQTRRPQRALEVIDAMMSFAPGEARLWHEAGLLHAKLGNLKAAARSLQRYLDFGADSDKLHDAATLLQQLRARLN